MRYLLLLAPASNRVYAGSATTLAAAELEICGALPAVTPTRRAGVDYLAFDAEPGDQLLEVVAGQSARLALFEEVGDLLRPVELPDVDLLDDDFVTIPKYPGKTNEQFTRLLLNITRAAAELPAQREVTVLDPMCGRGTTLTVAWTQGLNAAGVEVDGKAFEAMGAFWRTWLRRKRLKHSAETSPVRRDGKSLGRRFDARVTLPGRESGHRPGTPTELTARVFTGDTRDSAALFGKRKFELIVVDAPYGVVHGSHSDVNGLRSHGDTKGAHGGKGSRGERRSAPGGKGRSAPAGDRDRSPAELLRAAVPVWAGQLAAGGALGISWNTFGLAREDLAALLAGAGLEVLDGGPWLRFGHRVDSSIYRDVMVARRHP